MINPSSSINFLSSLKKEKEEEPKTENDTESSQDESETSTGDNSSKSTAADDSDLASLSKRGSIKATKDKVQTREDKVLTKTEFALTKSKINNWSQVLSLKLSLNTLGAWNYDTLICSNNS